MKKYKLLNEVLIEWNESSKQDSDNIFLKSEDIEESLKYFVYRLNRKGRIKIFNEDWHEFKKYKDKVWINGKHIKLNDNGRTVDKFTPGEYKVYIEDIIKVTDMTYMFYDCEQLVSAFIPNSIMKLGYMMFSGCIELTSVTIPNSVTSIGGYGAFHGCTSLTSVIIPNSVTAIGPCAFYGCTSLTSITIPDSVTEIGNAAFEGCGSLTSVIVNRGNAKYDSRNNCNAIIETATNTLITGCKNTTIPNSVTSIGRGAFYDCTSLTSITIPDSVTSIGVGAFRECTGLTSVTIPSSVTSIGGGDGAWVFYNCINLKTVYVEDINKFNQIEFEDDYSNPTCYGAQLIELKK